MEKERICKLFGCSMEQLNKQYAENAKVLGGMRDKALRTEKKVNGYTAEQLTKMTDQYTELAK